MESVEAQTFKDFEVIVVDDGSTDSPESTVKSGCLSNAKLIRHPHNRGAEGARNTGIATAFGRFVAFLNSDDMWRPDKLAQQMEALQRAAANEKACATGYILHKGKRNLTICPSLQGGQFQTEILYGCTISPGTTLVIGRFTFDSVGRFDENLDRLEDWDWLLRFAEFYDIAFVSKPLADFTRPNGLNRPGQTMTIRLCNRSEELQKNTSRDFMAEEGLFCANFIALFFLKPQLQCIANASRWAQSATYFGPFGSTRSETPHFPYFVAFSLVARAGVMPSKFTLERAIQWAKN